MKRRDLEKHLREHDCRVVREGGGHTIFANASDDAIAAVPRHAEIKTPTVRQICKTLGVPVPAQR